MDEYKPNSHKYKEEQARKAERPKAEKVVAHAAKTRKKSDISKLSDVFISEDVSNVKSYVLMDILVPAVKKAISDIVTNGIDMILYGESGRSDKRKSSSGYVSYRDYSRKDHDRPARRSGFDFDDVIFESRAEAERAIDQMIGMIERYGYVTVGDLFDMADLTAPHTAYNYGWFNVAMAESVRTRNGDYVIKLPKAMPIEK